MANLFKLPTCDEEGGLQCVVETPRGSKAKFIYDPQFKIFRLSKSLVAGLTYPHDWGFVPSTLADDGDPLDVMILHDASTYPGMVICSELIGVLEMYDKKDDDRQRNDRFFAVPKNSHSHGALEDVRQLPKRLRQELETFFEATTALQKKTIEVIEWRGPKEARTLLDEARRRYEKG